MKLNGEASNLDALYVKLAHSKVKDDPDEHSSFGHRRYVTDRGDLEIEAEWTVLSTIRDAGESLQAEHQPGECAVVLFRSRDADECHVFFAVHDNQIVLESCHFMSEEPRILVQEKDDDPVWHSHRYFDEAVTRYWGFPLNGSLGKSFLFSSASASASAFPLPASLH